MRLRRLIVNSNILYLSFFLFLIPYFIIYDLLILGFLIFSSWQTVTKINVVISLLRYRNETNSGICFLVTIMGWWDWLSFIFESHFWIIGHACSIEANNDCFCYNGVTFKWSVSYNHESPVSYYGETTKKDKTWILFPMRKFKTYKKSFKYLL